MDGDGVDRSDADDEVNLATTTAQEDEGGVTVTGGREAIEPERGVPTETRIYAAVGGFYLLLAVVYAVTAREPAGTALLLGAAIFALVTGAYFALKVRSVQEEAIADEWPTPTDPPRHEGMYLPNSSIWPIGIGVGAAVTLAGIPIGWWVCLPGAALLIHSLIGFAAQSRDRT